MLIKYLLLLSSATLDFVLINYFSPLFKLSSKQDIRGTKIDTTTTGATNQGPAQTNLSLKQDNVTIKGLQANVTVPKVTTFFLAYQ